MEELQPMRKRAFHPAIKFLSLFLASALSAQAGPIRFGDVVHVLTTIDSGSQLQELRVRTVSPASQDLVAGSTQDSGADTPSSDSNLAGSVEVASLQGPAGAQTIEQGDISGTICDCGEIKVPGGGFPFFALLPLAAIPFLFIHKCKDCENPTPTPTPICDNPPICSTPTPTPTPSITPTPTPTPSPTPTPEVPEPSSLLLLGTGLAMLSAGARRRYLKSKISKDDSAGREE
jgi:hypothetical protein